MRNLFYLLAVFFSFPLTRRAVAAEKIFLWPGALLKPETVEPGVRLLTTRSGFFTPFKYQNKTSSGVDTLICVCTGKASGSTEDSCAGTQPQNLVGKGHH
jgi:hypothetical protein